MPYEPIPYEPFELSIMILRIKAGEVRHEIMGYVNRITETDYDPEPYTFQREVWRKERKKAENRLHDYDTAIALLEAAQKGTAFDANGNRYRKE